MKNKTTETQKQNDMKNTKTTETNAVKLNDKFKAYREFLHATPRGEDFGSPEGIVTRIDGKRIHLESYGFEYIITAKDFFKYNKHSN